MGKNGLFALLILLRLLSVTATKCKSVEVKAPGRCRCTYKYMGRSKLENKMVCKNLTEAPVIPNDITKVYFMYSSLKRIPAHIFANATNIRFLKMNYCNIQSIDDDAFQNLTKLTHIDLTVNYITSPDTLFNILNTCPQLKRLIAGQAISAVIDTQYLPTHHQLTYLDLAFNTLADRADFINLHRLKYLHLNRVISLRFGFDFHFSGMHHLSEINLDMTGTWWIKCGIFNDLPKLGSLRLAYNFLFARPTLESRAVCMFRDLVKLKHLDLSNSRFKTVPETIFQNLTKLEILDLGRNQIDSLPKTLFQPLKEIERIVLSQNKITVLYPEHFQNLGKLKSLELLDNQLQCTCTIRPFVAWLENNINRIGQINNLTCKSPDDKVETLLINYKPAWIKCDNHGWLLAGLSGTLLLIILLISVTVYYFRWDIRFWLAVRRTRARMRQQGPIENEAVERIALIEDQEDYHAFASYCSKDSEWVKQELVVNLEEADDMQFRLCIDERDFTPGMTVLNNISLKMTQSKKIIFVVSRSFIESRWCTFEVDLAQTRILDDNSGMIIIIFLENIPKRDMPKSLCRLCKHVTHITWDESPRKQELFWKRLKLAINA